jgi:hypothetical protein
MDEVAGLDTPRARPVALAPPGTQLLGATLNLFTGGRVAADHSMIAVGVAGLGCSGRVARRSRTRSRTSGLPQIPA